MAQFNPEDYETVASRIQRFLTAFPEGRIITENQTTESDRKQSIWIVKASIFLNLEEQIAGCPKATGLAFEIDGQGMANKTSALENCETSSIGRALANLGMSGDLRGNLDTRVTREEMDKVARGQTPKAPIVDNSAMVKQIGLAKTLDELQTLWETASKDGMATDLRPAFSDRKKVLSEGGK